MSPHHSVEIVYLLLDIITCTTTSVPTVRKYISREVADSRIAGIFIRDTAYFHCVSLNYNFYKPHFIE